MSARADYEWCDAWFDPGRACHDRLVAEGDVADFEADMVELLFQEDVSSEMGEEAEHISGM